MLKDEIQQPIEIGKSFKHVDPSSLTLQLPPAPWIVLVIYKKFRCDLNKEEPDWESLKIIKNQ